MKSLIILSILFFVSCKDGDKNLDGREKNYTPIISDTNCINPWNKAYFELSTKNFDTVVLVIKTKLISVLGAKVFDEGQAKVMADSIRKAVFNLDSAFILAEIQVDTTNLLRLGDDLNYYLSKELTPRKTPDWKYILTQFDPFTYQQTEDFEVGYTITPCIKKILKREGQFKRKRKGNSLPEHSKASNGHIDKINVYNCILNISILIQVDDKTEFLNDKRQFYQIKLTDTAKVFTTIDIANQK